MMGLLVRTARKIRRNYIPNNWFGLPFARAACRRMIKSMPGLEGTGVSVNIGGAGYFKVHPSLVVGTYAFETWGSGHNSGFSQWIEACRGKKRVFDIGAHIGLYALPASRVIDPTGCLYAFEPGNTNRAFLEQHVAYNQIRTIAVVPDLVGDEQKTGIPFFEAAAVHGMNTMAKESVANKKDQQFHRTLKNQICLDDFCREHDIVPEVIKIDVEGGEYNVFQGAREVFKRAHPLIFLSVHPAHLTQLGSSVAQLYNLIHDLGYSAYTTEGRQVSELKKEEYILSHESMKA
ncbi:FkbM family methyltransferase [Candidatus Uhrbacteria bacterium]|nr:FkbM family methyltransferase [Candidatus Uhrbacteria bacterium]